MVHPTDATQAIPWANAPRRPTGLFKAIAQRFRHRLDYRRMERLSDHQLKDIGLTRADIRRAMNTLPLRGGGPDD